jgi:uncharacterized protein with GYD domain
MVVYVRHHTRRVTGPCVLDGSSWGLLEAAIYTVVIPLFVRLIRTKDNAFNHPYGAVGGCRSDHAVRALPSFAMHHDSFSAAAAHAGSFFDPAPLSNAICRSCCAAARKLGSILSPTRAVLMKAATSFLMASRMDGLSFRTACKSNAVDHPQDRKAAISKLYEVYGAKLEAGYIFPMGGEFDGLLIVQAPNDTAIEAIQLVARSGGAGAKLVVVPVIAGHEFRTLMEAAKQGAASYAPPGR